jgi:hypothetical protein
MLLFIAYIPNYFNLLFPLVLHLFSEGRIDASGKYTRFAILYPSIALPFSWLIFLAILILIKYCNNLVIEVTPGKLSITAKEIEESL